MHGDDQLIHIDIAAPEGLDYVFNVGAGNRTPCCRVRQSQGSPTSLPFVRCQAKGGVENLNHRGDLVGFEALALLRSEVSQLGPELLNVEV